MSERGVLLYDPTAEPRTKRRGLGAIADMRLPIANSPDAITVMVVGGAGKHSSWQPTFGDGTKPSRRLIARRDGTPVRRVADLAR